MFNKIVWATDGSAGADHALGYARDLARTTGAELVVVHGEEMSTARSSIGYTRRVDEEDLEAKIKRQVAEITDSGIPVSVKVIGGHAHPATLIAEVAEEKAEANHRFAPVIEAAKGQAQRAGARIDTHLVPGHVLEAMVRLINERGFDLLVVGFMGTRSSLDTA